MSEMMNKFMYGTFVVLGLFFANSVMAGGITSLKDFYSNTESMRASFHQIVNDNQGNKVQEVEGTMQLQRPNKFRWDYNEPYEQQIVSDGKAVFLYDTDLEQVTVRQLSNALGSSPAALLAGGSGVEKNFKLENANREDGLDWVLAQPKDEESGFDRIFLGFKANKLSKLEMHDSFSHVTYVTFQSVERNPTLQAATFLFKTPEGVDVVGE